MEEPNGFISEGLAPNFFGKPSMSLPVTRSDNRSGPRHTIRVSALARRTITPLSGLSRISGFALSSAAGRTEHSMTSRFICNLKDGARRFSALL